MYRDDYEGGYARDNNGEDVYSKPVRAGKRTYFFDVKSTKTGDDFFLTITESKRRVEHDGRFSYDKHKIFLYKEDFEKFVEGLQEALAYIKTNCLKDVPEDGFEHRHDYDKNKANYWRDDNEDQF
ncbi:MAG: DUF3276 family protein [Bacteroidales bacterium]|nr:DUF3276 family protein [Bacteroidales bacterium]